MKHYAIKLAEELLESVEDARIADDHEEYPKPIVLAVSELLRVKVPVCQSDWVAFRKGTSHYVPLTLALSMLTTRGNPVPIGTCELILKELIAYIESGTCHSI